MESEPDSPSVAVRLSEPIWRYGAPAHVELLVRCVQLQQLLERETLCSSAVATLEQVCEQRPRARELVREVLSGVDALTQQPGTEPIGVLDQTGLSELCPLVGHFLGDPSRVYRSEGAPSINEYIDHAAAIQQLHSTALMIRADATAGRHKYVAHKLALLYHAVNASRVSREVLRRRIEERFEEAKELTEGSDAPVLPPDLVEWVVRLCDEVEAIVLATPPSMMHKLEPVARYLGIGDFG